MSSESNDHPLSDYNNHTAASLIISYIHDLYAGQFVLKKSRDPAGSSHEGAGAALMFLLQPP